MPTAFQYKRRDGKECRYYWIPQNDEERANPNPQNLSAALRQEFRNRSPHQQRTIFGGLPEDKPIEDFFGPAFVTQVGDVSPGAKSREIPLFNFTWPHRYTYRLSDDNLTWEELQSAMVRLTITMETDTLVTNPDGSYQPQYTDKDYTWTDLIVFEDL